MYRRRVLLLDDEPSILRAVARVLAPYAQVYGVTSLAGALAALEFMTFDAALIDYQLRGETGEALFAELHLHHAHVRRILFTALPQRLETLPLAECVVPKPFTLEQLVDAICAS